ncbi:MAG: hypothetical protein AAF355_07795 [Myxococcota bacterium]
MTDFAEPLEGSSPSIVQHACIDAIVDLHQRCASARSELDQLIGQVLGASNELERQQLLRTHLRRAAKRRADRHKAHEARSRIARAESTRRGSVWRVPVWPKRWRVPLRRLLRRSAPEPTLKSSMLRSFDLDAVLDFEAGVLAREELKIRALLDVVRRLAVDSISHFGAGTLEFLFVLSSGRSSLNVRLDALETWLCLLRSGGAMDELAPVLPWLRERMASEVESPLLRIKVVELLAILEPNQAAREIRRSLASGSGSPKEFLYRRGLIRIASGLSGEITVSELPLLSDASGHVRQGFASSLAEERSPAALELLATLALDDAAERVRAFAMRALFQAAEHDSLAASVWRETLRSMLTEEQSELVIRVALQTTEAWARSHAAVDLAEDLVRFIGETEYAHLGWSAASILCRWACNSEPATADLLERLEDTLQGRAEGAWTKLKLSLEEAERVDQVLPLLAAEDFPVSYYRRRQTFGFVRGERRGRRLWRLLYELRNPRPDKRQDVSHVTARVGPADAVAVPRLLAEVTQTKVPGERRVVSRLGDWAPLTPRVDDFLLALDGKRPRRILTPAGAITIIPPRGFRNLYAWAALSTGYRRFAALREEFLDSGEDPAKYFGPLERLGFVIEYAPATWHISGTPYAIELREADRTFSTRATWSLPAVVDSPLGYLLDDKGSLPSHLLVVVLSTTLLLLLRGVLQQRSIERLIGRIPVVIGGWGTRGKSGTERLKAALFQGLGYDVWVKTTGCEAMVIHGIPGRPAEEVFLYRPYDKPTIWEQLRVVDLAVRGGAQVFLWECMALRPRFVEVLAHRWMNASVSTLTNAYPDHEDVMGPSGEDVARVIASFMSKGGVCFTAEEQMLPILKEQARLAGTDLRVITPTESDLIAGDLLDMFPYQEHPRNIALTVRMAEHFGIDRERAVLAMAEHVVPDLGVLKTYPAIQHRYREAFFTNGMSANERAGCLSNWKRLGLFEPQPPDQWVVTVVNNRSDRIPRSRVFAKILVQDLNARAHLCIGTGLKGLRTFLAEELDVFLSTQNIAALPNRDAAAPQEEMLERFDRLFDRLGYRVSTVALREEVLRIALAMGARRSDLEEAFAGVDLIEAHAEHVAEIARSCVPDVEPQDSEEQPATWQEASRFIRHAVHTHRRLTALRTALLSDEDPAELDRRIRSLYRELFLGSVVFLEDVYATGDQVIDRAVGIAPPGSRIHLVGLQNIKGTGLDFVYRWLSIEKVLRSTDSLSTPKFQADDEAQTIRFLGTYGGYGLFDCRVALRALRSRIRPDTSSETKLLLERSIGRLEELEQNLAARLSTQHARSIVERIMAVAEQWLDPLDSIARAVRARRVQEAFVYGTLSQTGAAARMREITSRDKGGWLYKAIKSISARKETGG